MEIPSHRACTSCRSLKTRCLQDETNKDVCERCVRFGRQCVFTPIQKRKQRKRTDARVAELEKEMSALRALLKPANASSAAPNPSAAIEGTPQMNWSQTQVEDNSNPLSRANSGSAGSCYPQAGWSSAMDNTIIAPHDRADPVNRGHLSLETARHLVEQYKSDMYPYYPIVYIPPDCTADDLRRTKPMLFLAILAAAAGKEHHDLAIKLDRLVLEEYANRTVLGSEKSLELVQSLLVSSTWYQPPTRLNQFKYAEYIHMAEVMAKDIGIASRPLSLGSPRSAREDPDSHANLGTQRQVAMGKEDTTSIASRRTYLAVLIKSMGTMITSRRATTMRVTSYARESLRNVAQCSQSVLGDRILTAWTHLLIIAEEIGSAFNYDDPDAVASICDVKVQLMMAAFKRRLSDWRHASAEFDLSPTLQMTYYTVRLYLSEVVLHVDHPPEDFNVPYRMSQISYSSHSRETVPMKPAVEALAELVENSHALLDSFMSLDTNLARALPLGMFVRVSYAAFVLAKLCASAVHESSQLSPLIDQSTLYAESYMNRTLLFVRSSIGVNGCRLPAIFLNLMSQMREWCIHKELVGQVTGEVRIGGLPQGRTTHSGRSSANATTSAEGTGSRSSASPDTPSSTLNARPLALTGTYDDNYEKFGNDAVVRSTTAQGQLDQAVDISDTLTKLEAALSLSARSGDDGETRNLTASNKLPQQSAETNVLNLAAQPESSWPDHTDEMWYDESTFALLSHENNFLDFVMAGLEGVNGVDI